MSERYAFLALAALAGLFAGAGDTLLNHWAKSESTPQWFFGGLLVLNIALVIFAYVLRSGTLAESVVLFIVANVLCVAIVSQFVLHESISASRWLCLSVALLAVVAMEFLEMLEVTEQTSRR